MPTFTWGPRARPKCSCSSRAALVLDEIGRDGEWIQVRLRPELRKTGLLMRWYKNEDRGWMHDSTVEVVKPEPR